VKDRVDRIFRWIWRIDAVLILFVAAAAMALVVMLLLEVAGFSRSEPPGPQLAEVAGTDLRAREDLRLRDFHPVAGTSFLYAQLASPSDSIRSGSSGGWGSARNLLFFDTTTRNAHWLFPDNEQILASFSFLRDPPGNRYGLDDGLPAGEKQVTTAILLEIQNDPEAGANGSIRSITMASPDGRELTPIASSTQGLMGYHHARKDAVFVFYVSGGTARVGEVDPVTRTVRSDGALAAKE
jgi:hypothetical protein